MTVTNSDIKHGLKQAKKLEKEFYIFDIEIDRVLGKSRIFRGK